MNKVILRGRLGAAPELRYTPGGDAVCNMSVATSESYTDKAGAKQEVTEWHRVVIWGKLAELCNQYLAQGREVLVEGQNKTRSWEDSNSGVKKYSTEVVVSGPRSSVEFIGGSGQQNSNQSHQSNGYASNQNQNHQSNSTGQQSNTFNQSNNINTNNAYAGDDIPF